MGRDGDFVFLDEDDLVLDVINELPEETKKSCLKFLSSHPDLGSSFMFVVPKMGYGVIMKFVAPDDQGLVFMGADDARTIIDKLEILRDSVPKDKKIEVQERINAIRYAFIKIDEKIKEVPNGPEPKP